MASDVDICNLALSHLRAGSINSLDESSLQAQQCKLQYPLARDQLLEESTWGFATRVRPLTELGKEVFNWRYVYDYPNKCLRINRLIRNWETISSETDGTVYRSRDELQLQQNLSQPPVQYRVLNVDGNRVVVANEPELRAEYTEQVTDATLFSTMFVMTLSHLLAANVAIAIAGVEQGRQLRSDSLSIYSTYLSEAIANDLNERSSPVPDSEFITVRS